MEVEDFVAQVHDEHSGGLDCSAKVIGSFETGAEFDGFPSWKYLLPRFNDSLARKKALNAFHSAKLVYDRLNLTEIQYSVFHDNLPLFIRLFAEMFIASRDKGL